MVRQVSPVGKHNSYTIISDSNEMEHDDSNMPNTPQSLPTPPKAEDNPSIPSPGTAVGKPLDHQGFLPYITKINEGVNGNDHKFKDQQGGIHDSLSEALKADYMEFEKHYHDSAGEAEYEEEIEREIDEL